MSIQNLVKEFHNSFNHPINDSPQLIDDDLATLRENLLTEEHEEYLDASINRDLTGIADALADIVYICYGTALCYGIDLDAVIKEVHRSNMTKLEDGKPLYRADGKILKGSKYEEPDIEGVLHSTAREYYMALQEGVLHGTSKETV